MKSGTRTIRAGIIALTILLFGGPATADDATTVAAQNATDVEQVSSQDATRRSGQWRWRKTGTLGDGTNGTPGNRGRVFGQRPVESLEALPTLPPPQPEQSNHTICQKIIINNILFPVDSTVFRIEGAAEIDKLVAEMKKYRGDTVLCIGHTDDTGSEAYNLQLGLRRAQAVADRFIASGIAPERVSVKSMGETQPAVPNDSPANRALNRRVEFEITLGN